MRGVERCRGGRDWKRRIDERGKVREKGREVGRVIGRRDKYERSEKIWEVRKGMEGGKRYRK